MARCRRQSDGCSAKRQLRRMSGANSSMLPMASGMHNCFMIANRERHGAFLLLTIIPLGTDEEGELLLNLPKAFQREDAEFLDMDGSWRQHRLATAGKLLRHFRSNAWHGAAVPADTGSRFRGRPPGQRLNDARMKKRRIAKKRRMTRIFRNPPPPLPARLQRRGMPAPVAAVGMTRAP